MNLAFLARLTRQRAARRARRGHSLEILEARIAPAFAAVVELSGLTVDKGFRINGAAVSDHAGSFVKNAGDVNGDGIDDLVVGVSNADPNGISSGATYVVFGSRTPVVASLNLAGLTGANGFKISGVAAFDYSGRSVSAAGDVNGDGIDDLLIGAPDADPNGSSSGAAYVIFGSRTSFAANLSLSTLTGANGFKISGVSSSLRTGQSVSGPGDVNGDGIDDLLIGAPFASPNGQFSGASYVVFGSRAPAAANLNLSGLTSSTGFQISGAAAGDRAGQVVSGAGDVNGDGIDDLLIGAPYADVNGSNSGSSYVVFGSRTPFSSNFSLAALGGANGFQLTGASAADYSGRSVSAAGDVNGDGFDDVLIGASAADPNGSATGASYVVFGSRNAFAATINLANLSGPDGFRITGAVLGDRAGHSVSTAGDVNGDGLDDIVIGAYVASPRGTGSGASYVVFGGRPDFAANLNLSSLNGVNGFKINGAATGDRSGTSVSAAGDFNGDGLDDLLIGAPYADATGTDTGTTYLLYGQPAVALTTFPADLSLLSLTGANGFTINGVAAGDESGYSVTDAGDVNGDGLADLLIGAFRADPNASNAGASYVVFGKSTPFGANLNLSALTGANGFRISGVAANDYSGLAVSAAGDVNGDGIDDLLLGAPYADPNGTDSGASYVVFGSRTPFAANLNLSALTGANGFKISGAASDDRFGRAVSAAGDLNGDGIDDLLIGASFADAGSLNSGASYVVFGKSTAFAANLNVSALTGANGFKISGVAANDHSGRSVSAAGDVNGDGIDDLLIGADAADPNGDYSGASYVVFGSRNAFAANLNLSALTGANGFKISGAAAYDASGRSVGTAGDINGDGIDDLLIGAPLADPNGSASGSSYVIFGSRTPFTANLNLSALTGANGFRISGVAASNVSGGSVSAAGDLNGDGFDDLLIGAYGADANGTSSGASYVVFGRRTPFAANVNLSALTGANGSKLSGVATFDRAGWSVSTAGDLNGDGIDDLLIGAIGADPNGNSYAGSSYVVFGHRVPPPVVSITVSLSAVAESSGTGLLYTFTRTGGDPSQPLTVFFTRTGTATFTPDYTATSSGTLDYAAGTLTIPADSTSATVSLIPVDDRTVEGSETAILTLALSTAYAISGGPATGTIADNDTASIGFSSPTGALGEGAANGALGVVLTINASGVTGTAVLGRAVTFNVTATGGTAIGGGTDYTLPGVLTLGASTLGGIVPLATLGISNDSLVEGPETVNLSLAIGTDGSGGQVTIAAGNRVTTITDDDTATIGFTSAASVLGETDGADVLGFVLTLTPGADSVGTAMLARAVTFNVTSTGTATGGGTDYLLPTPLTFAADSLSGATASGNLAIANDSAVEGSETAILGASIETDNTGGQVAIATGAAAGHMTTITDDDTASVGYARATSTVGEVMPNDVLGLVLTITPGAGSPGVARLDREVAFSVTTGIGGTATGSGTDYTLPGPITFGVGALNGATLSANLAIFDDRAVEGSEAAVLGLALVTDGTNGQAGISMGADSSHTATITDNDSALVRFLAPPSTTSEGDGNVALAFRLDLSGTGSGPVVLERDFTFAVTTDGGTATGAGTDYTLPAPITYAAGSGNGAARMANLGIINDSLVEGTETAELTLVIVNDGTGGRAGLATNPVHTTTIIDNDTATIGFANAASTMGEERTADALGLVLTITPGPGSTGPAGLEREVTLSITTAAGGTATGGNDYTLPSLVTFSAGATQGATQLVELSLINDSLVEGTETANFGLASGIDNTGGQVTLATGTAASHTTTIIDDDTATFGFAAATSTAGEAAAHDPLDLVLTITPGAGSTGTAMLGRSVSVNVIATGGTATGGGVDYTLPPLTTFAAGSLQGATQTASLAITDDAITEVLETANLGLALGTDQTGGQVTIAFGTAGGHLVTITDDDSAVSVSTATMPVAESATAGQIYTFTRDGDTSQVLTVTFTAGGTASSANDYRLTGADLFNPQTGLGTLTFAAGRDTATVTLTPNDDTLVEGDETASLAVNSGVGYGVGTAPASGAISDNDTAIVSFVSLTNNAPEDTSPLSVAVQLTTIGNGVVGAGSLQDQFAFSVIDLGAGTATNGGVDYRAATQNFTLASGDTGSVQNVSVSIVNDQLSEGNETFSLGLGHASSSVVTLASSPQVVTIQDNDVDVAVTSDSPAASTVAGSGAGNLHFTVTVQNTGLTDAVNLVIEEAFTLPAGVTFASAVASTGTFVVANGEGGGRLALPFLAKNATATLDFFFTAASSTDNGALAYVVTSASSAGQLLINPTDDTDLASATVIRQADLAVTITVAPDPVAANRDLTYTIHVTNNGPSDAASVSVTDRLPANTTFVSATGPAGWVAMPATGQDEGAVFTTESLASGASADLTFVVHLAANAQGKTIANTASVSTATRDLDGGNDSDTETTLVSPGLYVVAGSQPEGVARGIEPRVRVFDSAGHEGQSFLAYEASYTRGIHLAIGDMTGDGVDDIVTATQTGTGRIRVFDGSTHQQVALGGSLELAAFDGRRDIGAFVALGDVDGDRRLDIIAGSASRGGKVSVFSGTDGHLLKTYTPFGAAYVGSVNVAAADLDGDGQAEIVSGANASRVHIDFSGLQTDFAFYAFAGRAREGAVVTLGDTTGDGLAEIIVGHSSTTARSGPALEIFQVNDAATRPTVTKLKTINLARPTYNFGVRVAATDLNSDGLAEILVASGYAGQSTVQIIDAAAGQVNSSLTAFPAAPKLGISVAASPAPRFIV